MIREKLIFKVPVEVAVLVCSTEGLAFIAAHETATGLTMGDIQKNAVCGLVSRLQGNLTTNGSDIWSKAIAADSKMWIHAPTNDTTISYNGCNVELFGSSVLGTFNNFVSGDLTVNGITGGSGKYFDSAISPQFFPQDDSSVSVYAHQINDISNSVLVGSDNGNVNSQCLIFHRTDPTELTVRINGVSPTVTTASIPNKVGLISSQRLTSTHVQQYYNGVQLANVASTSYTRSVHNAYFHAFNRSGTLLAESLNTLSLYQIGLGGLTANESLDFYEAVQWYQTNIITGGREV